MESAAQGLCRVPGMGRERGASGGGCSTPSPPAATVAAATSALCALEGPRMIEAIGMLGSRSGFPRVSWSEDLFCEASFMKNFCAWERTWRGEEEGVRLWGARRPGHECET